MYKLILALIGFVITTSCLAEEPIAKHENTPKKIALVLSGGGARGAAHIGVLEVLQRERIPLACIVGTSMGGLVAGSYASGISPSQMRQKLAQADWNDMFLDSADYAQLSFRKKRTLKNYLPGTEIGVTKEGMQLQPGVIAGEKIKLFFNQLAGDDRGERLIEELPVPLAIVATDIGTGEKYVFKKGSLSQAMRASMSVPGLMAPVEHQGHKWVDGGLVDNLPVNIARELCDPDVIIAVNVSTPLKPANEIGSLISITSQMIGILTKQNVEQSIASLTNNDVYIEPALGDFSALDFQNYAEAADTGHEATEVQLPRLKQLAATPETFESWSTELVDLRKTTQVDEIRIHPMKKVHPDFVAQHIRQQTNTPLDREQLEQDLTRAYGDGFYENVDYRLYTENQKNILEITATEKKWSSDYISLGFDLTNEYRAGSTFDLRAFYRNTWLNHLGGEFFASADIGSRPGFEVEIYQPLTSEQTYFIQPSFVQKRSTTSVFFDDEKIAEYKLNRSYSELVVGRNLDIYGQISAGWRQYRLTSTASVAPTNLRDIHESYGGVVANFTVDRRNRLYFPTQGWSFDANYFDSDEANYSKLKTQFDAAVPYDNFVLATRASYTRSLKGELPPLDAAELGGFLNLSSYSTQQIFADSTLYGHIRAEHILGRMPLGFNGDLRVGLGIEAARVRSAYTITRNNDWIQSGVVYLGGETPLGPAYLGCGFSLDGKINIYLQIGSN